TLDGAYHAAGLTTPFKNDLPGLVNNGLQKLYARQHYSGGWCWYECENYISPDAYLTAYVFQGMSAAKAAGYPVSDHALDQAHSFLTGWLGGQTVGKGGPPSAQPDEELNTRAYVLYALADGGQGDLALTRALAARAVHLSLYGQAYLALALQKLGANDDAKPVLDTVTSAAKQTSTTAHWEEPNRDAEYWVDMNSDPRTTALVLDGLVTT